ncbi:MAG: hypothetical protein GY913_05740 [Proteobacteria bacterium]|nr:hypothetical protein [Pseudomonadota bacterium]MCP4916406.1 hypothetical protein [Pseudomonadota bacterium]
MIPNKKNQVRVSANFAGEVELCCRVGEIVHAGFCLVEVEGDGTIERLCAKQRSRVIELCVEQDAMVEKFDALVVVELLADED